MTADLRLLVALDALLQEESVTGAAERLHLSPPAMSRTLVRIRRALGDPVLVRAGRQLVPTPRAVALRTRVHALVQEARLLLSPQGDPDLARVERSFAVVADDGYAAVMAPRIVGRLEREAPHVTVRFLAEGHREAAPLRSGVADIEIGVIDEASPELRIESLFQDRHVGVVRADHPFATRRVTLTRFAGARHLSVSRRGRLTGPVDEQLAKHGQRRAVVASLPNYSSALLMLLTSDLVAAVPETLAVHAAEVLDLHVFELPLEIEPIDICLAWHPRHDGDSVHAWLRRCVREMFQEGTTHRAETAATPNAHSA
ncbi:LysR family transcriptional regulator [Longimycelium tulufanense]|uniref:LysR family transcriptional regulator n=1 Tax=Longimycelium tulufanense TaxID=907463 RepID=A0A8J3CDV0_9PSEU|nr:LysR family transcriptional regulator [Longimycelium tulufanense]GGM52860.1 LysR family transcriptional regulator [Longimycelium tulufanense]